MRAIETAIVAALAVLAGAWPDVNSVVGGEWAEGYVQQGNTCVLATPVQNDKGVQPSSDGGTQQGDGGANNDGSSSNGDGTTVDERRFRFQRRRRNATADQRRARPAMHAPGHHVQQRLHRSDERSRQLRLVRDTCPVEQLRCWKMPRRGSRSRRCHRSRLRKRAEHVLFASARVLERDVSSRRTCFA